MSDPTAAAVAAAKLRVRLLNKKHQDVPTWLTHLADSRRGSKGEQLPRPDSKGQLSAIPAQREAVPVHGRHAQ